MWKPRASKLYARRVLRTARLKRLNLALSRETHTRETKWAYRSFNEQEEFLSRVTEKMGLGNSFVNFCARQTLSGKPLRILDDGAGNGDLLAGLKKKLNARRIKTETIGISLIRNARLLSRFENQEIDHVHWGIAERYVPRKPVDIIFSIFGSLYHTYKEVGKDHLLKFAYSLRPGGMMIMAGIFSKQGRFRQNLQRAFEKRGFKAQFVHIGPTYRNGNEALVIQRQITTNSN